MHTGGTLGRRRGDGIYKPNREASFLMVDFRPPEL